MGPKKGRNKEKGEHDKKPGGGGAALEYVRKLRKMEEQATTAPAFPLGTNLQDRLMAATTHLKPTARLKGSVEEEEEGSKSKELYHVKRYSPPKLATYTSLEMQELLASKVKHDIIIIIIIMMIIIIIMMIIIIIKKIIIITAKVSHLHKS